MSAPLFVSFHTPDERYTAYAKTLRASLERFGLEHGVFEFNDLGSWVENCAYKPEFIRAWVTGGTYCGRPNTSSSQPIVWLDADAEVIKRPTLLLDDALDYDFAISTFKGPRTRSCVGVRHTLPVEFPRDEWFNSGTVFVNDTPRGRELAERWVEVQREHPRWWDQWSLQQAWCDVIPVTLWLPDSYCHTRLNSGEAVIRQGFASTEYEAVRV